MYLISNEYGDTPLVESYRTLRSHLQFLCNRDNKKLICITCVAEKSGVSEVAANLALSLSKNNEKVLLIDCNLRNPIQHIAFDVHNRGLTNHIVMDEDLTFHRNVMPHLDLITSGTPTEYPSEVVDSYKLSSVFDYVKNEYDIILVDTPPLLSVTDALVVAEKSDGVILVVKDNSISDAELIQAKERLERVGVPIIGSVCIDMNA